MSRAGSDVFASDTAARSHGAGRKDAIVRKLWTACQIGWGIVLIFAFSRHAMMLWNRGVVVFTC